VVSRTWNELMGRLPRLVPLTFMPTLLLRLLMAVLFSDVITGVGGRTVNGVVLVVPPGVVTVMVPVPCVAVVAMPRVAVI
jgi:hypothetical protein